MADDMHSFLNERLRLTLSDKISGQQLDSFVGECSPASPTCHALTTAANLTHLFKTVRPELTPSRIFVAVSEPSICGHQYCSCSNHASHLQKYKITIFVDRKEQGRRVTKPWLRVSSEAGFEDAVDELMKQSDELVAEAEAKRAEAMDRQNLLGTKRFEVTTRKSATCLVEVFEAEKGRERGFTLPSKGLHHRGTL